MDLLNNVNEFVGQYCEEHPVQSVIFYPHPFTRGGIFFVFPNELDNWFEHLTAVYQANLPVTIHCLRRREIEQPMHPGMFAPPLHVNERPLIPYWLKKHGQVLYGEDLRPLFKPALSPRMVLAGHIEGCMDYLRRYGILTAMIHDKYEKVWQMLTVEIRHLMATALLIHQIDVVSFETCPALFREQFQDESLNSIWNTLIALNESAIDYDTAVHAIWLFEQFLRGLREYTYAPVNG
ncbi:MAG: hypothetical protein GY943_10480 [Chloroflexi bacterium]|nr:hypothetical protein [Chloroflexota bacterium]